MTKSQSAASGDSAVASPGRSHPSLLVRYTVTAPALRPACMSKRKSPTTSMCSTGTPSRRAAKRMPSGAGLGSTSSSRVTMTSKSAGPMCAQRSRPRSTAARPLRVRMPSGKLRPRSC